MPTDPAHPSPPGRADVSPAHRRGWRRVRDEVSARLRAWLREVVTAPRSRRHIALLVLLVTVLAFSHLAVLAPTPLSSGPRPSLAQSAPPDPWLPPRPHASPQFTTFPAVGPQGERGVWVMPSSRVPIRFAVEEEVTERFGLDQLEAAIEVFNDLPGTRFGAAVTRGVDEGVEERRRDGVNRIFIDRRSCGERYLARAHLWSLPLHIAHGRATRYVTEVDIGLCERLGPEALFRVVRHELAHIAGLDHLCNPDDDCHEPSMGQRDHSCRIMYFQLRACQELTEGDIAGLVHLHPRLPRSADGDARATAARVARISFPAARRNLEVVVAPHDAPLVQQLFAATLAGHLDVPQVLVDEDCTRGPDGQALDYLLAVAGQVTAVGELPRACATTLQGSWELELETLPDASAVVERIVESAPAPPTRLMLAPRPDEGRTVPIAAAAAAGSVALEAPLMVLGPDGELGRVLDVLASTPSLREVIIAGDLREVGTPVLSVLREAGVSVRRLSAGDATQITRRLLEQPELAGRSSLDSAVVNAARREHAVAGVSLASALDGLLLPVDGEPTHGELALLDEGFDAGALVGGVQAISPELQRRLSRALDGDR